MIEDIENLSIYGAIVSNEGEALKIFVLQTPEDLTQNYTNSVVIWFEEDGWKILTKNKIPTNYDKFQTIQFKNEFYYLSEDVVLISTLDKQIYILDSLRN